MRGRLLSLAAAVLFSAPAFAAADPFSEARAGAFGHALRGLEMISADAAESIKNRMAAADTRIDLHMKLGDPQGALAARWDQIALWKQIAEADPDDPYDPLNYLSALESLADAAADLGRFNAAMTAQETAIAGYGKRSKKRPASNLERLRLARAFEKLGDIARRAGDFETAERAYGDSRAQDRARGPVTRYTDPYDLGGVREEAAVAIKLGDLYAARGRLEQANQFYHAAADLLRRQFAANPPEWACRSRALEGISEAESRRGAYGRAAEALARSTDACRVAFDANPAGAQGRAALVEALRAEAKIIRALGRYGRADDLDAEALALAEGG